jgi:hypothetical protein
LRQRQSRNLRFKEPFARFVMEHERRLRLLFNADSAARTSVIARPPEAAGFQSPN